MQRGDNKLLFIRTHYMAETSGSCYSCHHGYCHMTSSSLKLVTLFLEHL